MKLIELAAADHSDAEMALQLGLSKNAVEKRWAKLRKRFGVHSRAAIIAEHLKQQAMEHYQLYQSNLELGDELPIGIFTFDEERRVSYCNRKAADLLGVDISDLMGNERVWKQVTPGAAERVRIRQEFLDKLRDFAGYRTRIIHPDGREVFVAWSSRAKSRPIHPHHWWVIGEDLTPKREVRAAR